MIKNNKNKPIMYDSPSNFEDSKEFYLDYLQAKIDDTWEYATTNFEVGEELTFGELDFKNIICRINNAIEPKTGHNLGDDFKLLKFLNVRYKPKMGKRYSFADSIWITTNTSNIGSSTQSAIVRKCNNYAKWIYNGEIVKEPCILGYTVKYGNVYFNDTVNITQGTITIIFQKNKFSRMIKSNDRFIFGDLVYKIKTRIDFLNDSTYNIGSEPLIVYEAYLDSIKPDDDFDIGVCDMDKYKDEIVQIPDQNSIDFILTPNTKDVLQGQSMIFVCKKYINGIEQNDVFSFVDSDVPKSYYSFEIIDDNSFKITNNKMYLNNPIKISCSTFDMNKDFYINLKGLY